ncbi:DUF742 domain-containing protein [Actinokineospora sp. NBRC 105648]|uniref:DUF742 domain-containing protein n=1 Tax=Actinokineospora sp. NBRC 105648 TaxID=3032206 RepID=UPI0025536EB1|nr:DUF742 domain-containing protein [Actinokineospora sp. NBRC 105648]
MRFEETGATGGGRRHKRKTDVGRTGARFGPPGQWRAPEDPDEADPLLPPAPDSDVGLVGARFGGQSRKRRKPDTPTETEPWADEENDDPPVAADVPAEADLSADWAEEDHSEWLARPESHALVRPYAWTGGRTRTRADLAIEALVSTTGTAGAVSWEHRAITELCVHPRSVAEIAALVAVPLGVARVLISDLADSGVLTVHRVADETPNLGFMERVLEGLRKL